MTRLIVPLIFCLLILSGCTFGSLSENNETADQSVNEVSTIEKIEGPDLEQQSKQALIDFHQLLNQEQYDQAAVLYGGSIEVLQGYNPEIDALGKAELLQAACTVNGFICLPIYDASLISSADSGEFIYEVRYKNPDGTIFELGPCCGASEEIMPVVSVFTVQVVCDAENICQVMDLPPYVP